MSEKIARLGIERAKDMLYYIKDGDVWGTPLLRQGEPPRGPAQKVASPGLALDYNKYIYFLDRDGDVARKERALGKSKGKGKGKGKDVGAQARTITQSAITGHFVKESTAKRHPRTTVTSKIRSGARSSFEGSDPPKERTTARSAITGHFVKESTAVRHPRTTISSKVGKPRRKSPEQLDREIEECLAQRIKK